jgi:hypothetical protein
VCIGVLVWYDAIPADRRRAAEHLREVQIAAEQVCVALVCVRVGVCVCVRVRGGVWVAYDFAI